MAGLHHVYRRSDGMMCGSSAFVSGVSGQRSPVSERGVALRGSPF